MTHLYLLLALSITDAAFAGYRAAAGRNPRLHKVDYYLRSLWLGVFAGVVGAALMIALGTLVTLCQRHSMSPDHVASGASSASHWAQLDATAAGLVRVYGIFATLLLAVMLLWTYPKRRLRELSVVLVLGPCTLVRPFWIAAGALYVAWGAERWLALLTILAATTQLALEFALNLFQRRAQARRLHALLSDDAP